MRVRVILSVRVRVRVSVRTSVIVGAYLCVRTYMHAHMLSCVRTCVLASCISYYYIEGKECMNASGPVQVQGTTAVMS